MVLTNPHKDTGPIRRAASLHIPVFGWLVLLYVATALLANIPVTIAPALLEVRNIILHATAYAVQAALVLRVVGHPPAGWTQQHTFILLAAMLAMGLGQETLQTLLRRQLFLANSLFDLGIDVSGAGLGIAFYRWIQWRHHTD
nr:hypothetical protein [Anaerolineae bacterium]